MRLQIAQPGVYARYKTDKEEELPVGTLIPTHFHPDDKIPSWLENKVIDLDALTPVTNPAEDPLGGAVDPLIGAPAAATTPAPAPKPAAATTPAPAASDKPPAPPEDPAKKT